MDYYQKTVKTLAFAVILDKPFNYLRTCQIWWLLAAPVRKTFISLFYKIGVSPFFERQKLGLEQFYKKFL